MAYLSHTKFCVSEFMTLCDINADEVVLLMYVDQTFATCNELSDFGVTSTLST